MIVHQAEGVAFPRVALDGDREQAEVGEPVMVVTEDVSAVHAACGDVEIAVRQVRSEKAGHEFEARRPCRTSRRDRTDRHRFGTISRPPETVSLGLTQGQCRGGAWR